MRSRCCRSSTISTIAFGNASGSRGRPQPLLAGWYQGRVSSRARAREFQPLFGSEPVKLGVTVEILGRALSKRALEFCAG
jgi:hypothetical protein